MGRKPKFTCPRRIECGPWASKEGEDRWEARGHGLIGQSEVAQSCSFCGSLNPDAFMRLVEDGWWVGPTDKTYKAYLSKPLTDEQVAAQREQWLAGSTADMYRRAAIDQGLDADGIREVVEQQWRETKMAGGCGTTEAKFYFQHLSEEQMIRFVELLNSRTVKIGFPGYFYVRPFFVQVSS